MAAACVHVMTLPKTVYDQHTQPMQSLINVGYGTDISIAELAQAVGKAVGFDGAITFDTSKPDGSPRKLMNSGRLNALGWEPTMGLAGGLAKAYADFLAHQRVLVPA
jgi:GDP-L-fucose synthase